MMDGFANNNSFCFNFTSEDLTATRGIAVTLHILAILACSLAIFFIFFTKQHLQFVNRLILYLMVASLLWSVTVILQTVPVHHDSDRKDVAVRGGWKGICTTVGYFSQLMETAKILVVCWIVLHLFLLVIFKRNLKDKQHEAVGLAVVVLVPLAKDWIPFVMSDYGLSGLWCWIELTGEDCMHFLTGIITMAVVEYIPVLLAVTFTLVCFLSIVVTLCHRAHRTNIKWKLAATYQQGLAEAASLMAYPTLFAISLVLRVIHRTWYIIDILQNHPPSSSLWITHSVTLGLTGILIPLLYIMRPSNLKKIYCCRKFFFKTTRRPFSVMYRTNSMVSTEGYSDGESFVKEHVPDKCRQSNLVYSKSIFNTFSD